MASKRLIRDVLSKMPDDVTLGEIVSWANSLDILGAEYEATGAAELNNEVRAFFSKARHQTDRSRVAKNTRAKKKVLAMLDKLPESVSLGDILNRITLLRNIETGLAESDRGEGMDHDVFFTELLKENEENAGVVAAPGSKGPTENKKPHRRKRPADRTKLRSSPTGGR